MASENVDTSTHVQSPSTTCTATSRLEEQDTHSFTGQEVESHSSTADTYAVGGKEEAVEFEGANMSVQEMNRLSLMTNPTGTEPVLSLRMLMNSRVSKLVPL